MRYLHRIAAHEKFIASGIYQFYENGELTHLAESWSIHEYSGGARMIRIDQDARASGGADTLAEALIHPEGRLERLNVRCWMIFPTPAFQTLQADYVFLENYIQIGRTVDGGEREYAEVEIPPDTLIRLPQFILFESWTLAAAAKKSAESTVDVFVPDYLEGGGRLKPDNLPRIIEIAEEELEMGGLLRKTRRYTTGGGSTHIWLDEHDIALKLSYGDGASIQRLTRYAHR